jgi:Domain of unknown function (DUF4404)
MNALMSKGTVMPDTPRSNPSSLQEVQTRLREVAQMLRKSGSYDAATQRILVELVDELNAALKAENVPPTEVARLAESTALLAESLHQQHSRGILGTARDRLEGAMIDAEAHAPTAVGLARRLLDALANIGI